MGSQVVQRLRRRRDARGAAAVEFALIVIPFCVLLFGMLQYSFYFFSGQSGASTAREAARRAAVGDWTCSDLSTNAANGTVLRNGTVAVTRKYYAPTVDPVASPNTTRAAGAIKSGDNVRIVMTYKVVDMHFPFIPMPGFGGVRGQLQETAVARVETVTTKTVAC